MWNISFCCRGTKVNKEGVAPIEMVITIDKKRCFLRSLSYATSASSHSKLDLTALSYVNFSYCQSPEAAIATFRLSLFDMVLLSPSSFAK